MKNSFLLVLLLFSLSNFAQKKKAINSKPTISYFAKSENLIVETIKNNFQISIIEKGKIVEAIIIKTVEKSFNPINCKLQSFNSNGVNLCLLSWEEKEFLKTDVKTEDITNFYSKVIDVLSKKEVFSNIKKSTKITEKVFLDKNKTASEMQEKMRNEGFDLVLNPNGNLSQKSKSKEIKWVFDAVIKEFKSQ